MHLRHPDFVPIIHVLIAVLVGAYYARRLSHLVLLHHAVVNNVELVIKHYVAIDFLDDVVLDEDEAVHLDVQRKAIRVEARADLLVDLDEDVVRRFLD